MIRGKRALLADLFFHTKAYLAFRHLEPRNLIVFNYHRIRSSNEHLAHFDDGVFGPDQETLREHFRCLKRNADIISEGELIDHIRDRKKLPKSSVMITFDDGYRDNAELALPVIKEQRVPATFFVATQAIEEREVGWWDLIAYFIKKTRKESIFVRGKVFDLRGDRRPAIAELQNWMRAMKARRTLTLVEEIRLSCEVERPEIDACSRELMSWEQIRDAEASGVTIGSHTHSHRVLSTLNLSEQLEEFQISKKILERELRRPVRSVAYPVGNTCDYHLESQKLAELAGYELGFSFHTGANRLDQISPFEIGRVSPEESIALTCAAVTLPSVFARSRCKAKPIEFKKDSLVPDLEWLS